MTDSHLQELRRAWEASGSVEDEAAYLRERVRVGDLTQERLELAARCGHQGAIKLSRLETRSPADGLELWVSAICPDLRLPIARTLYCRIAIAAAELGETVLKNGGDFDLDPPPASTIEKLRDWVADPREPLGSEIIGAAVGYSAFGSRLSLRIRFMQRRAVFAVKALAFAFQTPMSQIAANNIAAQAVTLAARASSTHEAVSRVQGELLPWILSGSKWQ